MNHKHILEIYAKNRSKKKNKHVFSISKQSDDVVVQFMGKMLVS